MASIGCQQMDKKEDAPDENEFSAVGIADSSRDDSSHIVLKSETIATPIELIEDQSHTICFDNQSNLNFAIVRLINVDKEENIRINQIFYPNGKVEGPFGDSVRIPLQSGASYRLRIGKNLMADDGIRENNKLIVEIQPVSH